MGSIKTGEHVKSKDRVDEFDNLLKLKWHKTFVRSHLRIVW